jgi:catechol 2,3-dioxygenase-like lactoylglutathione lyase family enzyme
MIDHISLVVRDLIAAREFYQKALAPLGYEILRQYPNADDPFVVGLGEKGKPDLWIAKGEAVHPQHIALRVPTRKLVQAFYAAALEAGGKDNGPPGVRAHYHPNYYGAFVLDADGHNLEAVCHEAYLE